MSGCDSYIFISAGVYAETCGKPVERAGRVVQKPGDISGDCGKRLGPAGAFERAEGPKRSFCAVHGDSVK